MSSKKVLITTAIDYVNARPHVGHAVEKVQADVLARYYRSQQNEVYFLTGADENSIKNVLAAKKESKEIKTYIDENTAKFEALKSILNLSYDKFIRTTSNEHLEGCKKFWEAMKPTDIYKKNYDGLYCVGCEEFKTAKDLVDGKCPEHQIAPEKIAEENYFFKLSNYQDQLLKIIESNKVQIVPDFRRNEVISFIKGGLEDFSISRSRERACNWGVPVPGDEKQIMYVWVDALASYITALGYGSSSSHPHEDGDPRLPARQALIVDSRLHGNDRSEGESVQNSDLYQKFWVNADQKIHVIGKGIMRFHAIYWIAMLLSAGLPLPSEIYIHEYLTIDGQKMSKTIGNVIYPEDLVKKYGADGTRYLLLSALPYTSDGDISWDKMDMKFNADLANGLGNLLNRTLNMIQKYDLKSKIQNPNVKSNPNVQNPNEANPAPKGPLSEGASKANELLEERKFELALKEIWQGIKEQNQYIDQNKPWELAKTDKASLVEVLASVYQFLSSSVLPLSYFMPETAEKMNKQLKTLEPEALFPRI